MIKSSILVSQINMDDKVIYISYQINMDDKVIYISLAYKYG